MNYTISVAEKSDFSRINELFIQMLQTIHQKEDVSGYAPHDLDDYFKENEDIIYIAKDGDQIIAFLSIEVHREEKPYLYLDDFSVDKNYRGQGIGTCLLELAENYAEKVAVPAILLHVEASNTRAYALYHRFGYTEYENQGNRILMCKKLD